ncbi:MAG: transposase [Clostridium sp.]|nr:transposase [Clostridium sp.]
MLPNIDAYTHATTSHKPENYHKRALWHDYRSKCIYMITTNKMPGIPAFSKIEGQISNGKAAAKSVNTSIGAILCKALRELPKLFPEIRILQYIIMPDHIHLLLEATINLNYHISDAIRTYKQNCSRYYSELLLRKHNFSFSGQVFTDGYHDRILTGSGQLQTLIAYIRDNPRRLFLKQTFPEAFQSHITLQFQDLELSIYGNPLLLECPGKQAVRFSSRFSPEDLARKKMNWNEAIREGSPIISPFIHPTERECLDKAIAQGGKAIIIRENGFPEKWKPEKKHFEACAQGRLLFIAPKAHNSPRQNLTRDECLRLNHIAERLTAIRPGQYTLRRE